MKRIGHVPSASGARLGGDDYQHVLTWIYALRLLLPDTDVAKIEFEVDDAGNVDDLIVHRIGEPTLYHQIKFVVAQKRPLTHEWFITPVSGSKNSPLRRFYESYTKLTSKNGVRPEMALHTNRLPAVGDSMLRLVSGTDYKLMPRLVREGPKSAAGKVRREWADHLEITEDDLLSFLGQLAIRLGRSGLDDLQEQCGWAMRAVGCRSDTAALLAVVGAIRTLIRTGVRELDANAVQKVVSELRLHADRPRATLLIQSLQPDPWPETATASVDWVDLFEGEDAASRRQLKDPSGWNGRLKPELAAAVGRIRRANFIDVDVRGTMRLATGLLVGQQLAEVAGFKIAVQGREGEWSSTMERGQLAVKREEIQAGNGEDFAVALAISQPIRDDVVNYVRANNIPVKNVVIYYPTAGPSRESVVSPKEGVSLAATIAAALRNDTSGHRGSLHLFQSAPLPLAVMLGHLWNRMPITHIYEDLGPGLGYVATFTI